MTTTADLAVSLKLYRSTRTGATRLAARIWPLVEALRSSPLWLPRESGLHYMARSIFGNAGFDACVNYDSPEEFAEELRNDLDEGWPERTMLEGVEHYVLRPFFSDTPHLTEAGLGSLRVCSLDDIAALNVTPSEFAISAAVTGLSDEELVALISLHREATLTIVNSIRYLATALNHPTSALRRMGSTRHELALVMEPGVGESLSKLAIALVLPGATAPAAYFSSDWDKNCRLKDLPEDSTLASFLRDV
jgi:hypothetical protein